MKLMIEDLAKIREKYRHTFAVRTGVGRVRITVHTGDCGVRAGALAIMTSVMSEIESRHLQDVIVTNAGCSGHCDQEPVISVEVTPGLSMTRYAHVTPEKVRRIFDSHVVKGEVVEEYALATGGEKKR